MTLFSFIFKEAPAKTFHIIILSLIAGISEIASVLLTVNGAKDVAEGRHYMLYAVLLPTAAIMFIISRRFSQIMAADLAENVLEKLYISIANDIRHAELPDIERRDTSEIRIKMLNAQTITDAAAKGVHVFQSMFALLFLWFYVFCLYPSAGLAALLITLFAILIYEIVRKLMHPLISEEKRKEVEMADLYDHILYGAREIRIRWEKNEDLFVNWLGPIIRSIQETKIQIHAFISRYWIFVNSCFYMGMGTLAFVFSRFYSGETALEILVIAIYTWTPVLIIVGTLSDIEKGTAALDELRKLVRSETDRDSAQSLHNPLSNHFSELTLENIQFAYEGNKGESGFSVGPVNLTLKPGKTLFVVGGNGSGKTTLMKILTGLYPPTSGVIRINDTPTDLTHYRHLFSAVFSDFHLFDTIYGLDTIENEIVQKLLKQMNLDHKTRWIPEEKRFDNTRLSSGQMKRLALVVSLLEDKPIYVFDEWTADQDPHFRKYFYEILLPSLKERGKLIISVSHDDRYFHTADQLIRMEYGQIVSQTDDLSKELCNIQKQNETDENISAFDTIEEKNRYSPSKHSSPEFEHRKKASMEENDPIVGSPDTKKIRQLIFDCTLSAIAAPAVVGTIFSATELTHAHLEWRLFALFVLALTLYLVTFQRFTTTLTRLAEEYIADIRLKVTERVRHANLYAFEKAGIEKIRTALIYDMKSVSEISNALALTARSFLVFAALLFFMATLSITVFLLTLTIIILVGGLVVWNQLQIRQTIDQVRNREKNLLTAITDMTEGFKELRLDIRKSNDFFHSSFKRHAAQLRKLKMKFANLFADTCTLVMSLWQALFVLTVLILPFTELFSGHTLMTFVGVIVCLPILHFLTTVPRITLSSISIQRLFELTAELKNLEQESSKPPVGTQMREFSEIRYENLSFAYETEGEAPFSVGPMNLIFRPGEIVFVVGGNGSGKSTLMKMLTGLYPASGIILLNGVEKSAFHCRSLFSTIFYDFHLFDRLYGLKNIDADRVNDLLRVMGLDHKVRFDEDRFSTLDLSTGQRKRLAMVAKLMEDRPIYMFDEWAADQYPDFREYFYETLLTSFKDQGKTVIAVSHDDRYFHAADRVIRLEYGRLVNN